MEKVSGVLAMNMLEMLQFLTLVIVHHLILIVSRILSIVLDEGDTFYINGNFGAPGKLFSIIFNKVNTKFCLNLHDNADNSYLFVNGKKSLSLKPTIKMLTFQHNFVSEVYLMNLVLLSLEKCL